VEESDLAPDDGQTPKNDKSLLDDVRAGDSRHRLSFTIEPHGGNEGQEKFSGENVRIRGSKPSERLTDMNVYRANYVATIGKCSHHSQSLSPLSESSASAPLSAVGTDLTSFLALSPLFLPETTS